VAVAGGAAVGGAESGEAARLAAAAPAISVAAPTAEPSRNSRRPAGGFALDIVLAPNL
jgi:hypothetical protein